MKMKHLDTSSIKRNESLFRASLFVMPLLALFSTIALGYQTDANTDSTSEARPRSSIQIRIKTPTLDVDQVLAQVTRPLESAFSEKFGVENVQSISEIEKATLWIQCEPGNEDDAMRAVAELLRNSESISDDMQVELAQVPQGPILLVAIHDTKPGTPDDLAIRNASFVSQAISQLERIPNVAQVFCWSGSKIKLTVSLDSNALNRFGLSTQDVEEALSKHRSSLQKQVDSMEDLTSLWREVAALPVSNGSQEGEPGISLKRLAEVDINLVSLQDYPFRKMPDLPSHAFVLGIHLQHERDAEACANAIRDWVEELNTSDSIRATCNLGKFEPAESDFADSNHPPSIILNYEKPSTLKSSLKAAPSDFEIRITADLDIHQHQIAKEIDRKLQKTGSLTDLHSNGLETNLTSKIKIDEERLKARGVKFEDVQACIRKWARQISSSRQRLGPLVEIQFAPSHDALKHLQSSLRRLEGAEAQETSPLIELELQRLPVKVWRVGNKNAVGWIGRIDERKNADELKSLVSEMHHRIQNESNSIQIELRLNGRVFPIGD